MDYRRKFIEAAQRYNELSYKSIVAENERMEALKKALICTILASAGKTPMFTERQELLRPCLLCFEKPYTVELLIYRHPL